MARIGDGRRDKAQPKRYALKFSFRHFLSQHLESWARRERREDLGARLGGRTAPRLAAAEEGTASRASPDEGIKAVAGTASSSEVAAAMLSALDITFVRKVSTGLRRKACQWRKVHAPSCRIYCEDLQSATSLCMNGREQQLHAALLHTWPPAAAWRMQHTVQDS